MCRISNDMVKLVKKVVNWNGGYLFIGEKVDDTIKCSMGYYDNSDSDNLTYVSFEIKLIENKLYVYIDGSEFSLFRYLVGEVDNFEALQELIRFSHKYDINNLDGLF